MQWRLPTELTPQNVITCWQPFRSVFYTSVRLQTATLRVLWQRRAVSCVYIEIDCKQSVGGRPSRCPRPGLQRKRAAAALSEGGRAGPDQPTRATHPTGRPHTPPADRMYATDVRQTDVKQHHRLMPLGGGIISESRRRLDCKLKQMTDVWKSCSELNKINASESVRKKQNGIKQLWARYKWSYFSFHYYKQIDYVLVLSFDQKFTYKEPRPPFYFGKPQIFLNL